MKKSVFLFVVLIVGVIGFSLLSGCDSPKENDMSSLELVEDASNAEDSSAASVPVSDSVVVAYYFYGNYRCASCRAIEAYTKEALDLYFSDEIASGRLEFRAVNVEEKGNEHFVNDYKLYTKSVVLSKVEGGKKVDYKNLEGVWQYLRDKGQFFDYVKKETEAFLSAEGGSS
ncbi:MAG: nitrophenyl compound nitroreductase subunit ArsF family protein [Candidatus Kaelpia imicola]|nr:nitrophenyl compound nitroreductase subunit ArsF family protein [Candidatus Kaelpia imicola]